jgi:hypothetical protein
MARGGTGLTGRAVAATCVGLTRSPVSESLVALSDTEASLKRGQRGAAADADDRGPHRSLAESPAGYTHGEYEACSAAKSSTTASAYARERQACASVAHEHSWAGQLHAAVQLGQLQHGCNNAPTSSRCVTELEGWLLGWDRGAATTGASTETPARPAAMPIACASAAETFHNVPSRPFSFPAAARFCRYTPNTHAAVRVPRS